MAKSGFKQYFMASESNPFIFYIFTFYCLGFYELCAWTRPKSWVPHSKSYGTSVSLTEDVGGSACRNLPPPQRWNQHIHVQWKKRKTWPLRSLWKKTVLFTFHGGIGQGIARITRTTLDILFTVESFLSRYFFPPGTFSAGKAPDPWHYQRCLQSISCVDLDLGWYSLDKRKSMLYHHFRNQANTF